MPQQPMANQYQTIQRFNQEPVVRCWFVNDKKEFDTIRAEWNTIYIGINKTSKEIYTKQMTTNGTVDFFTYNQQAQETVQENADIKEILQKLKNIETRLGEKDERNTSTNNTAINDGAIQQQSTNANV
jgi:hypothetical protein